MNIKETIKFILRFLFELLVAFIAVFILELFARDFIKGIILLLTCLFVGVLPKIFEWIWKD